MPNNAPITLVPGSLPAGYCFTTLQQFNIDIFKLATATLAGTYNFFNYGSSTPAAEDTNKPWRRLFVDGSPDDWYDYFNGVWCRRYKPDPGTNERRIWVGDLTSLITHDGGSAGAVTDTTGPLWEEDTDFRGRTIMHAGSIPASDPAATITVGQNLGAGSHAITAAEMPSHSHNLKCASSDVGATYPTVSNGDAHAFTFSTESAGSGTAMSLLPPVRGVYIIKRTARIYVTV